MVRDSFDKALYRGEDGTDELFTGQFGLMGTWEVAHYLGVEKSRIARWLTDLGKGKDSIEAPVARLKSGPVWRREQVERKASQMYESATGSAPKTAGALERWLRTRRERRARPSAAASADPVAV